MVIENGTIRIYSTTGGGYDDHGNPIPVKEELGDHLPCNWRRNTYEKRGSYENGKFTSASYIILIDPMEFIPCRFDLYDSKGNKLGTYEAHQRGIAYLDHVDNVEITV